MSKVGETSSYIFPPPPFSVIDTAREVDFVQCTGTVTGGRIWTLDLIDGNVIAEVYESTSRSVPSPPLRSSQTVTKHAVGMAKDTDMPDIFRRRFIP